MKILFALILVVGCFILPMDGTYTFLEAIQFKSTTSYVLCALILLISSDRWATRVVWVEVVLLIVSWNITQQTSFEPLLSAHYGSIHTIAFVIEVMFLFRGAILDESYHNVLHHLAHYDPRRGTK